MLNGLPRIFLHYTEFPGDVSNIVEALINANHNNDYKIVIIDTSPDRPFPKNFFPNVNYVALRKPLNDYSWFKPDDFDSAVGITFESTIAKSIRNSCDELIG